MLNRIVVIQGLVVKIDFTAEVGFFRLLDADGQNVLLNIRMAEPEESIFINSQTEGVWDEPIRMPLPPKNSPGRRSVYFKIMNVLEIWNDVIALEFNRFTSDLGNRAHYSLAKNAVNQGDTLALSVPRPEEMSSMIASQVAMRRMDGLERHIAHLNYLLGEK